MKRKQKPKKPSKPLWKRLSDKQLLHQIQKDCFTVVFYTVRDRYPPALLSAFIGLVKTSRSNATFVWINRVDPFGQMFRLGVFISPVILVFRKGESLWRTQDPTSVVGTVETVMQCFGNESVCQG